MNKKLIALFYFVTLLTFPLAVFAIFPVPIIINNVLGIVWNVFIGAVIIMFLWAGFLFVTAQGDPSKISTAKKAVLWAVIGVVVGIAAYSAVNIIMGILGVGIIL